MIRVQQFVTTPVLGCALSVAACSAQVTPGGSSSTGSETSSSTSSGSVDTGDSTTSEPEDPCALAPDPGPCDAAFARWYFEPATGMCTEFTWGGCDGVVPFEDLATCSLVCESCETQRAPAMPSPVVVTITNQTDAPIYVEAAQPDPTDEGYYRRQEYVLVDDASGETIASHADACDDAFVCAAVASPNLCECDPGPPYRPGAIRIDPGGIYPATPWDSLVWSDGTIASECVDVGCGDIKGSTAPCRRHASYLGVFVVAHARASNMLDGDDCDATAEGWCETPAGSVPIDPTLEATTGFDFPTATIELSFVR